MSNSIIKNIQTIVGTTVDGIWGSKTLAAVASKLGCAIDTKSVQKAVGATADGVIGPKTLDAILSKLSGKNITTSKTSTSKLDVFLDAGHTSDRTREYPSLFKKVDWTSGDGKKIADILGFTTSTKDSIEHILNVAICKATKKHMEAIGLSVQYYDDPSLGNSAEIGQVWRKSNAANPKCFVSIHNNAAGSGGWESMSCNASGTVSLYLSGRSSGKSLSQATAAALRAYRKATGGPDNRADITATSGVGVLANASASIAATLIEVGFYDNKKDLLWMVEHIDGIGKTIAESVKNWIG